MPTRDCPSPRIQQHLKGLASDNPDILTRPFAKRLDDAAFHQFNKLLNSTKMPPILAKKEKERKERREWPKSQHFVRFYKPQILAYEKCVEGTAYKTDYIEEYFAGEHPYRSAAEYVFDATDSRVRINLKKSGACPHGETKVRL